MPRSERILNSSTVTLVLLTIGYASGQPTPRFEVASIKRCDGQTVVSGGRGGGPNPSPGRLRLQCQTVASMIRSAYGEFATGKPHPIDKATGLPEAKIMSLRQVEQAIKTSSAWIRSDPYSIEAKAESNQTTDNQTMEMMRGPMMQALLEDRFKMKIHRETREVPVYALTVDKGGPKLQAAKAGGCISLKDLFDPGPPSASGPLPPCAIMSRTPGGSVSWYRETLAGFCGALSLFLDRDVVDRTGIAGVFDIHMEFAPTDFANFPGAQNMLTGPSPAASDPIGSSIFAAVNTLGLKLKPAKGPGTFLVIDHIERPSEN